MSNVNSNLNDDLLVKYLVGEAAPEEVRQVEGWLAADPANSEHYNQLKTIWEQSLQVAGNRNIDEDAAYTRLQQRIKNQQRQETTVRPMYLSKWMKIAAIITIICTVGYITYDYMNRVQIMTVQTRNAVVKQPLPDGSVVTLNKNSRLAYPDKFKGNKRTVVLQGEAFFSVTKDKAKPFIILVNDVTVKVVGTSFNIKGTNGKTQIVVETGVVNVSKAQNNVTLVPGEKTEVNNGDSKLVKQTVNGKLYGYYLNKELVCNQTPLHELVDALNEVYSAHILIGDPKLANMPLTTVFKDQSLNQVLAVIAETFKISVEHKGDTIILR